MGKLDMDDPYASLRSAMRDILAKCQNHGPTHIEAPESVKAMYRQAADAGINPRDYGTLAECIAAIQALNHE